MKGRSCGCLIGIGIVLLIVWSIIKPPHWPHESYQDYGTDIAVDNDGNIYVTGIFWGTVDFDPSRTRNVHFSPNESAFLIKYNTDGELEWAHTWGQEGVTTANCLFVGPDGCVYVGGEYESWGELIDLHPGKEVITLRRFGMYVSKFEPSGEYQWTRSWGGRLPFGKVFDLSVAQSGNIYVSGSFRDVADFDPGESIDEHSAADWDDAFLSSFSSDGDFRWARTWGGIDDDLSIGVGVDGSGAVWVTGTFEGTVDFNTGPGSDERTANNWSSDVFLCKYDSEGNFEWVGTWGDYAYPRSLGISLDHNDNVYVVGDLRRDVDFDPGPESDVQSPNGIFINAFDQDCNHVWTGSVSGGHNDGAYDVAVDQSGNIYVAGYTTNCSGWEPIPGSEHLAWDSQDNAYLGAFDSDGQFIWGRAWGGARDERAFGVGVDTTGNIYVTGRFMDMVDFDPGQGTEYHSAKGYSDAFLSKFDSSGELVWVRSFGSGVPLWHRLLYLWAAGGL